MVSDTIKNYIETHADLLDVNLYDFVKGLNLLHVDPLSAHQFLQLMSQVSEEFSYKLKQYTHDIEAEGRKLLNNYPIMQNISGWIVPTFELETHRLTCKIEQVYSTQLDADTQITIKPHIDLTSRKYHGKPLVKVTCRGKDAATIIDKLPSSYELVSFADLWDKRDFKAFLREFNKFLARTEKELQSLYDEIKE